MSLNTSSDVINLSATELARLVRAKKLSAREVVEAHIRRIEAVNPQLNAVVIPLFDEALTQAKAADEQQAQGKPLGPLHGVPVTIKEQYAVAGTQTTLGLQHMVGKKQSDGPLVTRLRQAGAIILGKTNISQTLFYYEADNPVYGRTKNPWNLERTPGGSSGGEAAIIAAGGSPLGMGADFGGSLRIPSHFCGICTLKPTAGRLTNDDTPPEFFRNYQDAILPAPGPMARRVADLCLAMDNLVASPAESISSLLPPVPWPDSKKITIKGLRVGMYTDDGFFPAAPALRRVVEEAAKALKEQGVSVETFTPPDVAEALRLFNIAMADGAKFLKDMLAGEKPARQIKGFLLAAGLQNALRPALVRLMEARGQHRTAFILNLQSVRASTAGYWKLVAELNSYRRRYIAALDKAGLDALICPPFAVPAILHGGGEHNIPFTSGSYAALYNILGMPAGVIPASRVQKSEETDRALSKDTMEQQVRLSEVGSAGLPVGVQVVARYWREDIVLAVMAALEEHFKTQPDYPKCPVTPS